MPDPHLSNNLQIPHKQNWTCDQRPADNEGDESDSDSQIKPHCQMAATAYQRLEVNNNNKPGPLSL